MSEKGVHFSMQLIHTRPQITKATHTELRTDVTDDGLYLLSLYSFHKPATTVDNIKTHDGI